MGRRRDRLDGRRERATATRRENSQRKAKEGSRRQQQIQEILRHGKLPYTPGVMSWASQKLGKKAAKITADDIKTLLA